MSRAEVAEMALLLLVHLVAATAAESILEMRSCAVGTITENFYMSPENSMISQTSKARTDIECMRGCYEKFPQQCTGSYFDANETCYHLDGGETVTSESDDVGISPGKLIEMVYKGSVSSCGGYACDDGQICLKRCGQVDLPSQVCMVDNRDSCDSSQEYLNARHYWSNSVTDGRDTGTTMYVTYPKLRSDTGLRVVIHMNTRAHYQTSGCHRWYLTFDNNRCNNPQNIEQLDYSANIGNLHRAMDIDGTCYGLSAGNIRIDLVIDTCEGYPLTDGESGWNSARTMFIYEVIPQPQLPGATPKPCPSSVTFNYKYYSWNEEMDVSFDLHAESRLVRELTYQKKAADTSLRVKYNALVGVKMINSGYVYCGRWYIAIDGTECSPIGDMVVHQGSGNRWSYWSNHRRVRTMEQICDNTLQPGTYKVQIWIGRCIDSYNQPTNMLSGGFNSPSRLMVEEVRKDKNVDAVYGSGNKMYRSMIAKLSSWSWRPLNNGDDEADIISVTYTKKYTETGLRLTATGDHRTISASGYGHCGRWYFKIDGSECSNPGRIEGVNYFNYETNYHNPMQVSGICHGIGAGSRTIVYAIGRCSGYNPSEAYTGWQSAFTIFAEELRVDLIHTCSGNPVNCGTP